METTDIQLIFFCFKGNTKLFNICFPMPWNTNYNTVSMVLL